MSKPTCKLIGEDENIFNLLAAASRALRKADQKDKITEMCNKVFESKDYGEALRAIMNYVEIE